MFEDLEQWRQMRIDLVLAGLKPELRSAVDLAREPREVEPLLRASGLDEAEAAAAAEYVLRPGSRARYRARRLGQRTS